MNLFIPGGQRVCFALSHLVCGLGRFLMHNRHAFLHHGENHFLFCINRLLGLRKFRFQGIGTRANSGKRVNFAGFQVRPEQVAVITQIGKAGVSNIGHLRCLSLERLQHLIHTLSQ